MMTIGRRIALGFLGSFVALLIIGVIAYLNTQALIEESRWVTHTHEVIESITSVARAMREQEIGVRGYMLTGDDQYLDVYRAGQSDLRPALDEMERLVSDNPDQTNHVRELQKLI